MVKQVEVASTASLRALELLEQCDLRHDDVLRQIDELCQRIDAMLAQCGKRSESTVNEIAPIQSVAEDADRATNS